MAEPQGKELQDILKRQDELRNKYVVKPSDRMAPTSRGVHHAAFICRDVEETILFYRDVMGFPLVELQENRDYAGSTHFFFDIGAGNLIAFFDFPGYAVPDYSEQIGGIHHLALSVTAEAFTAAKVRLDERGIPNKSMPAGEYRSMFLADPNGLRIELNDEELGHLGGEYVL